MLRLAALCSSRLLVLVLAGLLIVYRSPAGALEGRGRDAVPQETALRTSRRRRPSHPRRRRSRFPAAVVEMREAILAAALSGHIEELRVPLDWNEMKPDVAPDTGEDPIAYWKKTSGDGEGREVLAALANMLQMRHASSAARQGSREQH